MRGKDHLRIADAVVSHFIEHVRPVPMNAVEQLERGSTFPDRVKTRKAHHVGREAHIRWFIIQARKAFISGDSAFSAFDLGQAFHYIADATCPGAARLNTTYYERRQNLIAHNEWEQVISRLPTPDVQRYRMKTPDKILSSQIVTLRASPSASFQESIEVCYAVLELVWRPIDRKEPEEQALIQEAKTSFPSIRSRFVAELPLAAGLLILPAAFIGLGVLFSSGWFLLGIPLGLWASVSLDEKYGEPIKAKCRWCRSVLEWYAIRSTKH